MQVERHYIKGTPEIIQLCESSKLLYNKCNWYCRQEWFAKRPIPDISKLTSLVQDEPSFQSLHNTKTAKQTIRKCLTDWTNFFKALRAWKKDKSKFLRKPMPPGYKEKMTQVIFYAETIRKKPAKQGILQPTNDIFKIKSSKPFKQVIVTPKKFGFIVDVIYGHEPKAKPRRDKSKVCSIDLGVDNLATVALDETRPLLVNGRIVKSINQYYDKKRSKAALRKRYFRLENYFHHASKLIVQHCAAHNVGRIVIGRNPGWKQKTKMGRKGNQKFQSIPFYLLQQKIAYKAAEAGIEVIYQEESYTSKASFFDGDFMPVYGEVKERPVFSGRRKHRGLYVSRDGFAVNADVNGALNIGRKSNVIREWAAQRLIADRSLAARPVMINPLKSLSAVTAE